MVGKKTKIKILIVDDSNVILNSLKEFFEDFHFDVVTCLDGLEGIQMAAEFRPDLIFLDLMMPNFDGLKMLQVKKVLKDIRDIPVIVISANTVRKNVVAAMEAGADKVISKPINKEQIITYVNELLGGENFEKIDSKTVLSELQDLEIKNRLASFFLESFTNKKEMLSDAIKTKDPKMLKYVAHEIKGVGSTIGYPELSDYGKEIEEKEYKSATDWMYAEFKYNQLLHKVKQIEEDFNKKN